ncbi:hypothetical protein V8C40DRAFT_273877 [Trichoderma camerunense]
MSVIYFSHTAGMTDCSPIKKSQKLEEMRHLVLQDTHFFITNGQWEKQETKWPPSTSMWLAARRSLSYAYQALPFHTSGTLSTSGGLLTNRIGLAPENYNLPAALLSALDWIPILLGMLGRAAFLDMSLPIKSFRSGSGLGFAAIERPEF